MIELPPIFDDLRPYYDREIPAAMRRIADDPLLGKVLDYFGKPDFLPQAKEMLLRVTSTRQFQKEVMLPLFKAVVERTVDSFTYEGEENAGSGTGRLFVSNHRDIVMDSCFQQYILIKNSIPTSHITFGSNLMNPQFVVDIGLSNKMFKTVRKVSDFDSFLNDSRHLSQYINYVVSHGESLWIAQRNGRTKDGFDKTDPGLLKMLLLGQDKLSALRGLHITPVSVSYRWEPCDHLKAVELYRSMGSRAYVKAPGEDIHSIVTGITAPKGNVHVKICPEVDSSRFNGTLHRSDIQSVVEEIDALIYDGYRLWDTNYAACDLLNGTTRYSAYYEPSVKEEIAERANRLTENHKDMDSEILRSIYLGIYAGPVTVKAPHFTEGER